MAEVKGSIHRPRHRLILHASIELKKKKKKKKKITERQKIVADDLQEAGLFHKGQYGGIKGGRHWRP